MTIVEVRGRGGQLLERVRCAGPEIRIGRAFDNDVVLEDPHASAHHLVLTRVEDGWRFADLHSLNGIRHDGRVALHGLVRSGGDLRIGHTHVRVHAEDHAVAPAVPLGDAETRLASLGRLPVWPILLLAYLAASAVDRLWDTTDAFEPLTAVGPLATEALFFVVVAAVWALIGRVLRHQGHFFAHLSLWLGLALAEHATNFVAHGAAYNAGSRTVEDFLDTLLSTGLLAFAVWGSLTLATQASARRRVYGAVGMAVALAGLAWSDALPLGDDFSAHPDYYARVEGPHLLVASPAPEAELAETLDALFERVDAQREQARDEAEPAREDTGEAP